MTRTPAREADFVDAHSAAAPPGVGAALALLLRLERRRLADPFRNRRAGVWAGIALPLALGVAALAWAGESVAPDARQEDGALLVGLAVSGLLAFQAYPVLFRPADDALLRRLGVPAAASYWLRAIRLGALALAAVALLMVPQASAGTLTPTAVAVALSCGAVAWGSALRALSGAARRTADPAAAPSHFGRTIPFDPQMASAAPLVFAPLVPLLAGTFAARFALVPVLPPAAWLAAFLLLGGWGAVGGVRRFERAAPRFAPRAAEMAYTPPPDSAASELVIGRGLAAVLPARAGAVRARDAAVVARRYRWAARVTWPVSIVCVLALLRAGHRPEVQGWVAAAGAVVLALHAAAVVGLGRSERDGVRWVDRAAGLAARHRLVGRWSAAFGMALALVVPVGIAWAITVPGSPGWAWPLAAGASAAVATAASLAAAGR